MIAYFREKEYTAKGKYSKQLLPLYILKSNNYYVDYGNIFCGDNLPYGSREICRPAPLQNLLKNYSYLLFKDLICVNI